MIPKEKKNVRTVPDRVMGKCRGRWNEVWWIYCTVLWYGQQDVEDSGMSAYAAIS